ncbi:MAG TPA: protein kinase [Thermoanaerobaculia bacterium]
MQLSPGDRIGQYEILRPLGAGGMGEVYCARDEKLGREVALKLLPAELSSNPEALRRFEQEARAASALNHPNIVTIYEINETDRFAWIAMELVDGEDLRTILGREPMTLRNALRIATKVADGLAAAHERGIVHRDLKPDNVMVTSDGFVKILDFGLAKQLRVLSSDETTLPHTSPGTIFGTVGYMSPEQATGRDMDARSDQFSFGVMLYEMVTRVRPFERDSRTETLAAILRDDVPPPSEVNETISRDLDRIVARCLEKQPRERYASTRDLARDLREVRDSFTQSSSSSRAYSGAARRTRPAPLPWVIAAIVVLVVGVASYVMWQRRDSAHRITSVAVMPFRDLGATAEGRAFADGISEMVATRLAQSPELRVAMPFDGGPMTEADDVAAVAKRAGASAVIRGTVQRGGGDVRVTVSLIDAGNARTLAATTATRAATDLFALQDAVAEDLLRALGRPAPPRALAAATVLGADDQRRFTEAVGLLQHVRDERSIDRAIVTLESVLRNARESGSVNALLARALFFKSRLARRSALMEQAAIYATRAVSLSPQDPEAHIALGLVQNGSGRSAEAVQSFRRALALRPQSSDALLGIADAYALQGREAEAEKLYRQVLALRPDETNALSRYGFFCYMRGRHEEAAAHFRKVSQLVPDFALAHSNLGGVLSKLGRNEEARAAYQKALALQPTAIGFTNLGVLEFSLGRYADARQSFLRATELAPSDVVAWANLGDACRWVPGHAAEATQAYERAVAVAGQALQVNPNDAHTRSVVALSLARNGKVDEGQREIRRALELDPTNASVLYKAGMIALIRGNSDSAVSWLERAVANGYSVRDLKSDPELEPLRRLPAFRKAVESKS